MWGKQGPRGRCRRMTLVSARHNSVVWSAGHFDSYCGDWQPWPMMRHRTRAPFMSCAARPCPGTVTPVLLLLPGVEPCWRNKGLGAGAVTTSHATWSARPMWSPHGGRASFCAQQSTSSRVWNALRTKERTTNPPWGRSGSPIWHMRWPSPAEPPPPPKRVSGPFSSDIEAHSPQAIPPGDCVVTRRGGLRNSQCCVWHTVQGPGHGSCEAFCVINSW